MRKVFVQGCTIMILLCICIPTACAQLINVKDSAGGAGRDLQQFYNMRSQNTQPWDSMPAMRSADGTFSGFGPDAIFSGINAGDRSDSLLQSAAAGLFKGEPQEITAASYYVDPETLCVAVSETTGTRIYPVFPYPDGLSLHNLLFSHKDAPVPVPAPGIMFLGGVCLIGLSGLAKRRTGISHSLESSSLIKEAGSSFRHYAIQEQLGSEV